MRESHRRLLRWARFGHLCLTMFGLVLVLFFAVTGFMLNHEDWFGLDDQQSPRIEKGTLPRHLKDADRLAIVAWVQREFRISGLIEPSDPEDDPSIHVVFRSPGRETEVTITRRPADEPGDGPDTSPDGEITVTRRSSGLAGRITDLHKGKYCGAAWKLVIDAVCVLLLTVSLTGLVLWTSLRTRRRLGFAALALGSVVFVAVYLVFVP
jgi:uncharacterized protein